MSNDIIPGCRPAEKHQRRLAFTTHRNGSFDQHLHGAHSCWLDRLYIVQTNSQ